MLFGGLETWRRWQQRRTRSLEQAAYYRVSPRNRLLVGAVYIGLIALLAVGMDETHILSSAGHSFARSSASRPPGEPLALSVWPPGPPRSMSRLVSRSRIVWRLS